MYYVVMWLTVLLCLVAAAVRYIETFHKWAGTGSNPVSPWHQQGAFPMVGQQMQSMSVGSSEPQYLMDD